MNIKEGFYLSWKVLMIASLLLYGCAGQKEVALNNDTHRVDVLIEQLKLAGWPDRAIEIYSQTGFKEYVFSEQNERLYLIPTYLAGDTMQEVWFDQEHAMLFERLRGKEQTQTCSRTGDLMNRFCVTCNSLNDTLKTQQFTIGVDNVMRLAERYEYDYKGDLKTHLVQSDTLYLDATFYNAEMPLRYIANYPDTIVYKNDSTNMTYWRSVTIKGELYGVNGFEYIAHKIVANKASNSNPSKGQSNVITIGKYCEYSLYSNDPKITPVIYLLLEGEYDLKGKRKGTWRRYDSDGQVIEETFY